MVKRFKFDVILEEEDLCDRKKEKERLLSIMKKQGRLVLYSHRRMGKTSLVHVSSQLFKRESPDSLHIYVDLNEVSSLEEVARRFRSYCQRALQSQFPIQKAKSFLNRLLSRLKVNFPGSVEVSLDRYPSLYPEDYLLQLFSELSDLSRKSPLIVMIDEFQGLAGLKEAQALLRSELKKLSRAAIILMGSNQRLLYQMFNDKSLPFFGFGEDLELKPIPIKDYLPYINERLAPGDLLITEEVCLYLIEKMNRIPNYVNELGAWIVETFSNLQLTEGHVDEALEAAADSKKGRYESALYGYSENQKRFLRAIAKIGPMKAYSGREMMQETDLSSSELARAGSSLEGSPLLSRDSQNGFFIPDPFLKKFLEMG